jgi:hypothetical protein
MKKSELKKYIKEIILAELTVTSDKETVKKLADQGIGVTFDPKAKSVSESEEEPTEDEIKKEKSLVKAQTEFTKITKELKANIGKSKAIVAKKPTERTKEEKKFLDKMEELTQRKKQLKTDFRNLEDED